MIGRVLSNRYEIIEKVGSGGMALVYKAKCRLLNRFVAIKILKDQYRENKEFVKRFVRESQAAASLQNANIVSVYDVGTDGDINYIVMELIEGITLKEYIEKNGMMNWRDATYFAMKICSALTEAHKNGIVHRDIKPHNVIITSSGDCKVTDFGIAGISDINETKKVDQEIIGSIHYISPEHAKGVIPDERSDIYSLGVTMYEMLTGKLPFDGESAISIAIKHLNETPVPIKDINIAVPLSLVNIVSKAMDKNNQNRYQTAQEMLHDMESLVSDPEAPIIHPEIDISAAETRKISKEDSDEIKEIIKRKEEEKRVAEKKEKPAKKNFIKSLFSSETKEDKRAVVAASVISVILIASVVFACLSFFVPSLGIGGGKKIEMPSLEGEIFSEMEEKYKGEMKFIVEEVYSNEHKKGVIVTHSPLAGMPVKTPVRVNIQVSKGSKEIIVPNVVGQDLKNAKKAMKAEGLEIVETYVFDKSVDEGVVIKQNPIANATAHSGDTVTLTISKGEDVEMVDMPSLIGCTTEEARAKLAESELSLGAIIKEESDKPVGTVIKQSLPAGSQLSKRTDVSITVSKGPKKDDDKKEETSKEDDTQKDTSSGTTNHEHSSQSNNQQGGNDTVSNPPPAQTSSYTLNLSLPTGKESVHVVVKQSGTIVYNNTVNTSAGSLSVNLTGSGSANVEVFYDGQLIKTQRVNF